MNFKSFSFRAEWLEAAEALGDEALKAELLLAITTYGITGEYTPSSSPVINALMTIIKAQIDATPTRRKAIKQQESIKSDEPDLSDFADKSDSSDISDCVSSEATHPPHQEPYSAGRDDHIRDTQWEEWCPRGYSHTQDTASG